MDTFTERRAGIKRRGLTLRWLGASTVGAGIGTAVGFALGGLIIHDRSTMISGVVSGGAIALLVGLPLWIAGNNRIAEANRYVRDPRKKVRQPTRSDGDEHPRSSKVTTKAVDSKEYRILCASLARGELPSPESWPLLHGKELRVTDRAGAEHTGTASILAYEPDAVTIENTRMLKGDVVVLACVTNERQGYPSALTEPAAPTGPTSDGEPAQGGCTIGSRARPTGVDGREEHLYDVDDTTCLVAGGSAALDIRGKQQTLRIREVQRYDSLLIIVLSEPIQRADGSAQDRLAFKRDPEGYLLME
jgi:hypothetical protein